MNSKNRSYYHKIQCMLEMWLIAKAVADSYISIFQTSQTKYSPLKAEY